MSDVEKLTEGGIVKAVGDIINEMAETEPNKREIATALHLLVGGALIDLRTIANAVAKLSTFEIDKVGEMLHVGPNFTAEEVETIEALRRGDIVTVASSGTQANQAAEQRLADEIERRAMQLYRDECATVRLPSGDVHPTWPELPNHTREFYRNELRKHL